MTFGYSRDDAGKFLPDYIAKKILPVDPFRVLDRTGVGQLIQMAVAKGRGVNAKLKVGICGEHGGEPSSVEFCHMTGLNYVSCSPFRVPIARLAAAQAALRNAAPVKKTAPLKKAVVKAAKNVMAGLAAAKEAFKNAAPVKKTTAKVAKKVVATKPKAKPAVKKSVKKKAAAKKTVVKKAASKKPAAKKVAIKKVAVKKTASKKASAKKK
jgi:hypothetical protein